MCNCAEIRRNIMDSAIALAEGRTSDALAIASATVPLVRDDVRQKVASVARLARGSR